MTIAHPTARRPFGRSDVRLSAFGVGAGTLSNRDGSAAFSEMLLAAWEAGLRSFDSAPLYLDGGSERRLGEFLSPRSREEFVVSTKVGRLANASPTEAIDDGRRFDYSASAVARSVEASRSRLGVEVIDVVYVHDVDRRMHGDDFERVVATVIDETLPALRDLVDQGVVRAVGVSSRQPDVCRDIAERAPVDGFMMAGAYTLLNHDPLDDLFPFCLDHGLSVVVASPFNTGILATGSADSSYDYGPPPAEVSQRVRSLVAACADHGVPLPGAALAFPLRHPAVAGIVVGNRSAAELRSNLDALSAEIPDEFWRRLVDEGLIPAGSVSQDGAPHEV
ncbi:hypothetical protein CSX12_11420 [Microbacterium sp. Y-01]|uniref:aldo/keto reductase n=1 Tax=Microbacterium sp. Y-01 TaxID=2048898 RepID=UPI000F5E97F3|nr:aldo/keto reductase [Microbacterium sp. Y-01]AZH79021.1 hypothetical protein CSX12_11420 [Microbacterium sp. Y-01]